MNIKTSTLNTYTKISILIERLDVASMEEIKEEVSPILKKHNHIILDMSAVFFLDSSGLSVLIGILKQLNKTEGSKFILCALTQQPQELMEITQLNNVFDIIKDCNDI